MKDKLTTNINSKLSKFKRDSVTTLKIMHVSRFRTNHLTYMYIRNYLL